MLVVYTGNGKGKTSAAVGQAVRAHGQGLSVVFGQFMKRADQAGEQRILAELLGEGFLACGEAFFRKNEDRPLHRQAALRLLEWANMQAKIVDMLILDEALYALAAALITREELEEIIRQASLRPFHLVLSGRGAPEWLLDKADIVTNMDEVKHVYANGTKAQRGIEF